MPTQRDPTLPFMEAIRALLGGASGLTVTGAPLEAGKSGTIPVYDRWPQAGAEPCIWIEPSPPGGGRWSTKSGGGMRLLPRLHVWSTYKGIKEAATIMNTALPLVTDSATVDLSGDNFSVVLLQQMEGDGLGYFSEGTPEVPVVHAVARLEALIADIT